MKKLANIKYPKDFICPKMAVLSDEHINKLIQQLSKEHCTIATGNILVAMPATGWLEVYVMIAQSKTDILEALD